MRAEVAVGEQHGDGRRNHGDREDEQDGVGEDRPHEQRQPAPAHAARAHVRDRHVQVDGAEDRGEPGEVDEVDPRVLAAAWRVGGAGERHDAGPPGFGRVEEERRVEDDPAGQQQPVGERVQARESHVASADHERHEVVGQAGHHRHDEQEDHRRAVQREQLVVDHRRDERVVGRAELQAHHQRLDAAEAEEHERRGHVEDPDALVVGGSDPARPAARLGLDALGCDLGQWGYGSCHLVLLSLVLLWVFDLAGAGLAGEEPEAVKGHGIKTSTLYFHPERMRRIAGFLPFPNPRAVRDGSALPRGHAGRGGPSSNLRCNTPTCP